MGVRGEWEREGSGSERGGWNGNERVGVRGVEWEWGGMGVRERGRERKV